MRFLSWEGFVGVLLIAVVVWCGYCLRRHRQNRREQWESSELPPDFPRRARVLYLSAILSGLFSLAAVLLTAQDIRGGAGAFVLPLAMVTAVVLVWLTSACAAASVTQWLSPQNPWRRELENLADKMNVSVTEVRLVPSRAIHPAWPLLAIPGSRASVATLSVGAMTELSPNGRTAALCLAAYYAQETPRLNRKLFLAWLLFVLLLFVPLLTLILLKVQTPYLLLLPLQIVGQTLIPLYSQRIHREAQRTGFQRTAEVLGDTAGLREYIRSVYAGHTAAMLKELEAVTSGTVGAVNHTVSAAWRGR